MSLRDTFFTLDISVCSDRTHPRHPDTRVWAGHIRYQLQRHRTPGNRVTTGPSIDSPRRNPAPHLPEPPGGSSRDSHSTPETTDSRSRLAPYAVGTSPTVLSGAPPSPRVRAQRRAVGPRRWLSIVHIHTP